MRKFITIAISAAMLPIANSPVSAGDYPDPTPEQLAVLRMFMEAKLAVKYCTAKHFELDDRYWPPRFAKLGDLDKREMRAFFARVAAEHEPELRKDPASWCADYAWFVGVDTPSGEPGPVRFDGFGK